MPVMPSKIEWVRAKAVAEAAGGFLGIGAVSKADQEILDELGHGFD